MDKSQARSAFTDFNFSTLNLEASLIQVCLLVFQGHIIVWSEQVQSHITYTGGDKQQISYNTPI